MMRIVNYSDLAQNMDKYLDLASQEELYISRGAGEIFILQKRLYLQPDSDLKRALTADEILPSIIGDIRDIFNRPKE